MPSQSAVLSRVPSIRDRFEARFTRPFDYGSVFKKRFERRLQGCRDSDEEDAATSQRRQHIWAPREKTDFTATTIQRHLRSGFYEHPTRGESRFRAKYRVPTSVYMELKAELVALDPLLDPKNSKSKRRDHLVPIDNKLLTTLRILGRGMIVQDDLDHSGMSVDMIRKTFKRVTRLMSKELFDRYVHLPQSDEEMARCMQMYTDIGLPGAFGSMDATHVPWDNCPFLMRNAHVGKEGFPTLTHNCVVSNDLFFMSVTRSKPGSFNDKTLVRFDKASEMMRNGEYSDVEFSLYDEFGRAVSHKDPYLIVDGGYHLWRHLMCGYGRAADEKQAAFTSRLTSARKDVECAFGVLKQRFRILKTPLQFRYAAQIDAVFRCCVMLHNRILVADGRRFLGHSRQMALRAESGQWGLHQSMVGLAIRRSERPSLHVTAVTDVTSVGRWVEAPEEPEVDADFEDRRTALKEHFWYVKYTRAV